MDRWLQRTSLILGQERLEKLRNSTVAVIGVGGVGGYAAEMIARCGVGCLVIMDSDIVSVTNRNRQIIALESTVGLPKVKVLKDRLIDINPSINVIALESYLEEDKLDDFPGPVKPDFVVDAIDTIAPKIALIKYCYYNGIPCVSSMGAGARTDATKVRIADISKTFNCTLACTVRKRLRDSGITKGVKVVFSEELPHKEAVVPCQERNKSSLVGSISYIPAVFGCVCAQVAIDSLQ